MRPHDRLRLLAVLGLFLLARETYSQTSPDTVLQSSTDRIVVNNAFEVGERLTFSIGWEFIEAGEAVMAVEKMEQLNGRNCYKVTTTAKSNLAFSALYPVKDYFESYVDVHGIFPVRFRKNILEGGYTKQLIATFDHAEAKAIIADSDSGDVTVSIDRYTQDVVSAFYFLRTQNLDNIDELVIPTLNNLKTREFSIRIIKRESVKVKAGTFECIVVETPIGPFQNKKNLRIWLTDDEKKIPVLMKSKIVVGSIKAELEKIEGVY